MIHWGLLQQYLTFLHQGDGGGWCDQILCRKKPLFLNVYLISTEIQWGEKLKTFISEYGAPTYIQSHNTHM